MWISLRCWKMDISFFQFSKKPKTTINLHFGLYICNTHFHISFFMIKQVKCIPFFHSQKVLFSFFENNPWKLYIFLKFRALEILWSILIPTFIIKNWDFFEEKMSWIATKILKCVVNYRKFSILSILEKSWNNFLRVFYFANSGFWDVNVNVWQLRNANYVIDVYRR